jgi:hypothetical protein
MWVINETGTRLALRKTTCSYKSDRLNEEKPAAWNRWNAWSDWEQFA